MSCQAKRPPGEESIWSALHHCGPGEVDRDDLASRRMAGVRVMLQGGKLITVNLDASISDHHEVRLNTTVQPAAGERLARLQYDYRESLQNPLGHNQ